MARLTDLQITASYQDHLNWGSPYPGIDFGDSGREGFAISPLFSGRCIFVGKDNAGANYVVVDSGEEGHFYYVHNKQNTASLGQWLDCHSDIVGFMGRTGNASGPHCHVGNKVNGNYIDFGNKLARAYPNPPDTDSNSYKLFNTEGGKVASYQEESQAFAYYLDYRATRIMYNNQNITQQFDNMANKLEGEIQKLQTQLDILNGTVKTLQGSLDNASTSNMGLKVENGKLKKDIEGVEIFKKSLFFSLYLLFKRK